MTWSLDSLNERERRIVTFGAIAAAALVLIGIVLPLDRSVARAHERVGRKQADLAWIRDVTPQLAGASVVQPATQESLVVVVDRSAREAGLGTALTSSEPSGAGGLSVRLEKAPFDILVGWLARLADQNGVRVESATIDSSGPPGLVNAAVILRAR